MTLKKVKPRPPLQRSGQTFKTFQRTNFLPVQPVHTEPCKFCCRLPCMAGVRRGSEGDFGSDRNTRGAKEGGREEGGGEGGKLPPSCAVSCPNSLSLSS